MITLSSSAPTKEGGRGKQGVQSLCQWAEVAGHPGLVTAIMQASNNPVVLMLTPNSICVQEIKVTRVFCEINNGMYFECFQDKGITYTIYLFVFSMSYSRIRND